MAFLRFCLFLALLILFTIFPAASTFAGATPWQAISPVPSLLSFAIDPTDQQQIYAGGSSGLWSSTDGGATWQHRSAIPLGHALAVDPFTPTTLYATNAPAPFENQLLISLNSGTTWSLLYQIPVGSSQSTITSLLADPSRPHTLFLALASSNPCCAQVARSLDGGQTWTLILPSNLGSGGLAPSGVTSLAALPGIAGLLDAGFTDYHGGGIFETTHAYATPLPSWSLLSAPAQLTGPNLLALAGTPTQHSLYSAWPIVGISQLIRNDDSASGASLTVNLPLSGPQQTVEITALTVNPAQANWLYAAIATTPSSSTQQRGIFITPDAGQTWRPAPPLDHAVQQLALATQFHILYALTTTGLFRWTITWPVGPSFTAYYQQLDGLRLLGSPISIQSIVNGYPAQYFEKARLEDHTADHVPPTWRFMDGLLVDELQLAHVDLPIGGDSSSLTYATLHNLASSALRLPPPPGYPGSGVMPLSNGSVFIPFTANLSGAPGHLVPARFWAYINRPDLFPGGWLHDVGLPISEAIVIQVVKDLPGGPVQRTLTVQAFQRTILTDDPLNPPGWRIERANVGTDYRKAFPAQVGP